MADFDGLKLWNKVTKTDPSHTKKVNQRGGFTAIDAYYQIQNATEQFGPVGEGWGWEIIEARVEHGVFIVQISFWHTDKMQMFDVFGAAQIMNKDRADADAPKKALTDGITKALSYLGFNTDIFLGKFEDNKYVAERIAEEKVKSEPPPKEESPEELKIFAGLSIAMGTCVSQDALKKFKAANKDVVLGLPATLKSRLTAEMKTLNAKLPEFDDDIPF